MITGTILLDIELDDHGFRPGVPPRTRAIGALFMLLGILICIGVALLVVNRAEPGFFRPRYDLAQDYDDRVSPNEHPRPTDAGR